MAKDVIHMLIFNALYFPLYPTENYEFMNLLLICVFFNFCGAIYRNTTKDRC